jgi:hypothetical protein
VIFFGKQTTMLKVLSSVFGDAKDRRNFGEVAHSPLSSVLSQGILTTTDLACSLELHLQILQRPSAGIFVTACCFMMWVLNFRNRIYLLRLPRTILSSFCLVACFPPKLAFGGELNICVRQILHEVANLHQLLYR